MIATIFLKILSMALMSSMVLMALMVPSVACDVDYRKHGIDWKMGSCDSNENKA